MFAAVLDTCVLWPSLQRDFLLSLAVEGLYRPLWSARILEELEFYEAEKLVRRDVFDPTVAAAQAHSLVSQMRKAFDDALVQDWEGLEGSYKLPDPDDEHVVAAAVVGGAGAIVTENFKDFPRDRVPAAVAVLSPQAFAADTVVLDPRLALAALTKISARYKNPPRSVEDVRVVLMTRYNMVEAANLIQDVM